MQKKEKTEMSIEGRNDASGPGKRTVTLAQTTGESRLQMRIRLMSFATGQPIVDGGE